jgi:hypothetical protein
VVFEEADHGMCSTHMDRVNQELLAFFQEPAPARQGKPAKSGAGRR